MSEQATPKQEQNAEAQRFSTDRPIQSKTADRFDRARFAERVSDTLARRSDPSSLVVGLYGPWGDGKTSTLNIIEERLKTHSNVVIVRFNPWRFSTQETLIKGFFETLAKELGRSLQTQSEKIKKALDQYGTILANIPVTGTIGKVLSGIGRLISSPDLDGLKKRVDEALRAAQKRVVVMIDDIDRLDRSEIHEMLKLVKLSADFSYMSYILAFDDEMVAQAIGGKYGAGDAESGRRFLEKIVQVPLQLPAASETRLREFAVARINEALESAGVEISEDQAQAFMRHFVDGIEPQMSTPRHVALYGNALTFALPLLKGEVFTIDHMLLEGIRLFYLPLYKLIRDNPDWFLKGGSEAGQRNDARVQRTNEMIATALKQSNARDAEGARSGLLEALFPRLRKMMYGSEWEEIWSRERKICAADYFPRYFSYGVPAGDVSDIAIDTFLAAIPDETADEIDRRFATLVDGRDIARLIGKLRRLEDTFAPDIAEKLIEAVALKSNLIPKDRGMLFNNFTRIQAAGLVRALLLRIPEANRVVVASGVLRNAHLPFAFEVFQSLRTIEHENAESRPEVVSPDAEAPLAQVIVDRIREDDERDALYKKWKDDAPALYWLWKRYGNREELSEDLQAHLNEGRAEVSGFLDIFVGWAYGLETGLAHRADLSRESYNTIAGLVDPTFVIQKLKELYGSGIHVPSMHPDRNLPVDQRIAIQFAALHEHVKKEPEMSAHSDRSDTDEPETP